MKRIIILCFLSMASIKGFSQTHAVKKMEFEKTVSNFVEGESDKYYVTFEDGTTGYLFYSKKYSEYYISNGDTWVYKTKEYALDALWEYKEKGNITDTGRKK